MTINRHPWLTGCLLTVVLTLPGTISATASSDADWGEILRCEDRRDPIRTLLPYLEDDRPELRARALLAIGRIAGPTPAGADHGPAHTALTRRLRIDPSPEVRRMAAFALGLLQTDEAAVRLATILASGLEPEGAVRAAAIEGLGRCGFAAHSAAMRSALADADPRVRQAALLAVWKGSLGIHLARVLQLSEDPEPETRWRAAYALMRALGAQASGRTRLPAGEPLTPQERVRVLERLLALATDSDPRVRLQVLRGLRSIGDSEDETAQLSAVAASAVRPALSDPDPRIRCEALRTLGLLLTDGFQGHALAPLLGDSHPHVRIEAARAVGAAAPIAALMELLAPALASGSSWERAVALRAAAERYMGLGVLPQALHLVARGQADAAWEVRYAAAEILAEICGEYVEMRETTTAVNAELPAEFDARIGRALADDPRVAKAVMVPWVQSRARVAQSLAQLISELAAHLGSTDEVLRVMTLEGLRSAMASGVLVIPPQGAPALGELLTRCATDPASDVRMTVVSIFSQLLETSQRGSAAERLLALAADDSDRLVRAAAIEVLQAAAGERDPWAAAAARLGSGPQERDWSLKDYRRARWYAERARAVIIETARGRLRIELFGADAPLTVYNFMQLAERGYFDDGAWHRVVPDFVVQDGCPRHDGWGGPGHAIRCEINPHHYVPGALGMALSGKDTGGSQFFLTLADQPHLDGRYTIFGQLIEGWEIMGAIAQGERIERVRIVR